MDIRVTLFGVVVLLLVGALMHSFIVGESSASIDSLNLGVYEKVPYVDVSAPAAMLLTRENKNVVIIDISEFYKFGHIKGAINYPFNDGSLVRNLHMLNREALFLVYGHYEGTSKMSAQRMVDEGFVNIYRLNGGYKSWVEYGYPFER